MLLYLLAAVCSCACIYQPRPRIQRHCFSSSNCSGSGSGRAAATHRTKSFRITLQVIRQYHGHLSGIYALALHPTLDILISGGRDSVARVWDMRTKVQVRLPFGFLSTTELCTA